MKKNTKKRVFLVQEVQNGDVLYSTFVSAANSKSLWRTSLMKEILVNKSFDSVLDIKEISIEEK